MNAMAKPKTPYTPSSSWDMGPQTLATLGHVPTIVREFRAYLRANPRHRQAIAEATDPTGDDKTDKARRLRARRITETWMRSQGYAPHVEAAEWTDPETGKRVNPNGVKRARRQSVAQWYLARGYLTRRQADAAHQLLTAWERNQRTPPAIRKVQVDTTPKPDANIDITISRVSAYHSIARLVPPKYRAYVMHVARDDRHLTAMPGYRRVVYMERLQAGLEQLADSLGL